MAICKYELNLQDTFDIDQIRRCGRKALPDSDYCICHEKNENKDLYLFSEEIRKIMENRNVQLFDFTGFYFPSPFDLGNVYRYLTPDKDISFLDCTFKRADFRNVIFNEADFRLAMLENPIFLDTKFRKGDFRNSTFGIATFDNSSFEFADFRNSIFDDATFDNAIFEKAKFDGVKFKRGAVFRRAKFKEASFKNVSFNGMWTSFQGAEFQKVDFSDSVFYDICFEWAKFEEKAIFKRCEIGKRISFFDCEILNIFEITQVNKGIRAYTLEGESFVIHKIDIGEGKPIFNFKNAKFSNISWIGNETDLRNALFLFSKIEYVDFTDAKFPKDRKILEEKLLEKKIDYEKLENEEMDYCPNNWNDVSSIYRGLKQAVQRQGRYDLAGDFYYREMECKKRGTSIQEFRKWVWLHFLSFMCGYGERPWTVIRNSIGCILLFAFLYYISGWIGSSSISTPISFFQSMYFSAITFTTLGYGDIIPTNDLGRGLVMIESFTGAIFIALFIFVFGRKMSR